MSTKIDFDYLAKYDEYFEFFELIYYCDCFIENVC